MAAEERSAPVRRAASRWAAAVTDGGLLRLAEQDVLAHDRIVLLDLQPAGIVAAVLFLDVQGSTLAGPAPG